MTQGATLLTKEAGVSRYGDHVKVNWGPGSAYGEWVGDFLCVIEQGEDEKRLVSVLMAWMEATGPVGP
jgi:hypothetical protein